MGETTKSCPEEINGIPVVCTWIKGWQEKMGEFIDRKQDFILLGEEEYLKQVEETYKKKAWKDFIKIILLGGAGAVALPGITSTSLITALGLGAFAVADPEPISKTAIIATAGVILGVTAAVLIWKIILLFKEKVTLERIEVFARMFGIKIIFSKVPSE